jgi:hypothetical protein
MRSLRWTLIRRMARIPENLVIAVIIGTLGVCDMAVAWLLFARLCYGCHPAADTIDPGKSVYDVVGVVKSFFHRAMSVRLPRIVIGRRASLVWLRIPLRVSTKAGLLQILQ